jgi:hypothetical protein
MTDGTAAYLVGTWKGVFVAFSGAETAWMRVGTYAEYGLIYAARFTFERDSDTLTVATLGRTQRAAGGRWVGGRG